jgi:hypothetical protein
MLQEFESENYTTPEGYPSGGYAKAEGIWVYWQPRPLKEEPEGVPTGAFVETLIAIVIERIEHYQDLVPCRENELALIHLDAALAMLNSRTMRRTVQGVEGTHAEPGDGTLADQVVPWSKKCGNDMCGCMRK